MTSAKVAKRNSSSPLLPLSSELTSSRSGVMLVKHSEMIADAKEARNNHRGLVGTITSVTPKSWKGTKRADVGI